MEFECKDGSATPADAIENIRILAKHLQVLRDELGEPIHINSGYRSANYNRKINGAKNSQHVLGKAADITVKSKTPCECVD